MIRAPLSNLGPGERKLEGAVGHYLARVLRLHAGSAFVAFDPTTGQEADALVVRAEGDAVTVQIGALREGKVTAKQSLTWIQGFAKADKCDAIVRDATELGATRVVIAETKRSIVKLDEARATARAARWSRIAMEAARQCGRSEAPAIDRPMSWSEALAGIAATDARFCLYEEATAPLGPGLFEALASAVPLAFACGPEGGLEPAEVDEARAAGWTIASLGPLILRTETVAAAVLGAVRIMREVR